MADLSVISQRIHNEHLNTPFIFQSAKSRPLLEHIVGDIKKPLYMLLGATCCLLLIACLNVANLLVARAAARRKELAIRTALGGGWLRLMRERPRGLGVFINPPIDLLRHGSGTTSF